MDLKDTNRFTMQSNIVGAYLNDIQSLSIISPLEEHDIFDRIKKGDEAARSKVITNNQRFVFAVAKKFATNDKQLLDLVSEGTIGLIMAIDSFDPTRGFRFLTHAIWYIRREIQQYLVNNDLLIKQSNTHHTYGRLGKLRNKFFVNYGRYPSTNELIEAFNERYPTHKIRDERDIYEIIVDSIDVVDINNNPVVNDTSEFVLKSASYNSVIKKENEENLKFEVNKKLNRLNERERTVLELSFGIGVDTPYNCEEIGVRMGLCDERVRQIKIKAIEKLRTKKVKANRDNLKKMGKY